MARTDGKSYKFIIIEKSSYLEQDLNQSLQSVGLSCQARDPSYNSSLFLQVAKSDFFHADEFRGCT